MATCVMSLKWEYQSGLKILDLGPLPMKQNVSFVLLREISTLMNFIFKQNIIIYIRYYDFVVTRYRYVAFIVKCRIFCTHLFL